MTTVNAHFDGMNFVPDEPVPAGLARNTRVKVVYEGEGSTGGACAGDDVLARIAELAVPGDDLPRDFAHQHEHYVKGTPKR